MVEAMTTEATGMILSMTMGMDEDTVEIVEIGRRNHRGNGGGGGDDGGGDGGGDNPAAAIQKEINNFKKGTKRDKNEYPKYKDERYWDSFELKVSAVARSHVSLSFSPLSSHSFDSTAANCSRQ
jgi:hypothetical protein